VIWEDLGPAKSLDLATQGLRELVEEGRSAGLRVSIEPHLESVIEEPERAMDLVQSVPGLQFTLDYGHFIAADIPASRVHVLIPYTGHMHARQAAPGLLQAPQTKGTIDYQDIVRRLFEANYQGFLSVEYTWQEWRGCNRLDVLSESVLMRDQLRSLLERR
jgi:sugar phosphate isomerase/epimerase